MENINEELTLLDNVIFGRIKYAIKPYKGKLFYDISPYESDWDQTYLWLELSDVDYQLEDSDYEGFGAKFEIDFPEYYLCEEMESVYSIFSMDGQVPNIVEVQEKLKKHPDYKHGKWRN